MLALAVDLGPQRARLGRPKISAGWRFTCISLPPERCVVLTAL
jgi:hypothetical protein